MPCETILHECTIVCNRQLLYMYRLPCITPATVSGSTLVGVEHTTVQYRTVLVISSTLTAASSMLVPSYPSLYRQAPAHPALRLDTIMLGVGPESTPDPVPRNPAILYCTCVSRSVSFMMTEAGALHPRPPLISRMRAHWQAKRLLLMFTAALGSRVTEASLDLSTDAVRSREVTCTAVPHIRYSNYCGHIK